MYVSSLSFNRLYFYYKFSKDTQVNLCNLSPMEDAILIIELICH